MSEFIRPQVQVEEINETSARVSAEPLERGYGDTLGNSLRRVLLSSLEGAAVEAIKIDGVQHEFMTIPNMVEDVTDIVLNVKGLVFRANGTSADEGTATISIDGPCEVTGADFFIPSEFELVNPEQHIATLNEGGHLTMSMRIGHGRGYVSYEGNKRDNDPIGYIHVDSLFSPVRRCAKLVEACRVGQHTDYDRLVLEIETNGAITPREAVVQAANIINQHMAAFMNLAETPEVEEEASIFAPEVTNDNAELDKQIEDLDLSVRSYNCLKRASIHSVRQLVEFSENDLLNIRNFGVKSIEEVKDKLESMGLSLKA
ncbi:DNA-directed RNA polymerase subunit alpha [Enorma sp.]|uniref:DNA-directed RNA polymerase subunit alpha n=1 Tax=Enorma sp. TaxID=1920692 RepID=UPI0025BDC803|nr:DNA-directed RNA polymerase subunit alpha [Enorma sp.]